MTRPISIAVVVPLYNKGPHVDRAIQAILDQTSPADEIIVVDDRSTDDGVERVRRFSDPRIKLILRDEPGPGGYAARNAGIQAATSEWIAFLDADDAWLPFALAEVRRVLGSADAGVSCMFSEYANDYGDGKLDVAQLERGVQEGRVDRLSLGAFLDAWLEIGRSPMWTSAVVARRQALIEAGLFPAGKCNRGGDKDMWLRLLTVGDALKTSAMTAIYYRDSVNMVTKTTNTNQRPYLCGTLEGLLPTGDAAVDNKIRRLINFEMYCHAREAWRREARVSPEVYSGFIVKQDPHLYALLRGMSAAPQWLLDMTYKARALKSSAK